MCVKVLMCGKVCLPDGGPWIGTINELASALSISIDEKKYTDGDWDRDWCFCGVDVTGILTDAGVSYREDDASAGGFIDVLGVAPSP